MSVGPSPSKLRIAVIVLLAGALVMVGCTVWMMATDQGAPVFLPLGGAMLAMIASLLAGRMKKKQR
jgi:hypothetical protein